MMRFVGVVRATWADSKPAARNAAVSVAGPACAPRAAPPSETLCGTHSAELPDVEQRRERVGEVGLQSVLRERLDRDDPSARCQGAPRVGEGPDGVAEVVEGVEEQHQVVVAVVRRHVTDLEPHAVPDAGVRRSLAGAAVASVGGYLGGHLAASRKVGTHDPAFDAG